MNEELQKQLANVIGGITQAVGKGADFALSQLPDIAQQYVAYGRALSTAWMLFGLAMAVLAAFLIKKACNEETDDTESVYLAAFGCLSGFVALITVVITSNQFVLVWFAPKIYVLQGLAGLLK